MVTRRSLLAGAAVLPIAALIRSADVDAAQEPTVVTPIIPLDRNANVYDLAGYWIQPHDIAFIIDHHAWAYRDWIAACGPETRGALNRALEPLRDGASQIQANALAVTFGTATFVTDHHLPERGLYFFPRYDYWALHDDPERLVQYANATPRIINIGL